MTILQPLGLLGLLTLPIILVLHMLRERHRRRVVSSLELWAWLEKQVRGAKPRRPPLSRILALQLLAALGLTAAVARPQVALPWLAARTERLILIVDTSTSMGAADVHPSRLAEAQVRATAELARLGGEDSAVLITAGATARRPGDSAQIGLLALAQQVADLRPAGVGNDWSGALALAAASTLPGKANRVVILTDGAFEFPAALSLTSLPAAIEWNLIGAPQPNQAILGLAARQTASGATQVFTRVANFSDGMAQRAISLLADGEVLDSHPLTLTASSTIAEAWTLAPGVTSVEVRLDGADVLPDDDRAALGVAGSRPVDVLLVSNEPALVERVLRALPNLRLISVAPTEYVTYQPHDLTVFHGWLPSEWPSTGVLVLDPPPDSPLLPVTGSVPAGSRFSYDSDDPLVAGVRLEDVSFGSAANLNPPDWLARVLTDEQGMGLVWRGATGSTRIVALTFAVTLTDTLATITRRPAFPVLIANAVAELMPPGMAESVRPGEAVALPSAQALPDLSLTDPFGRTHRFGAERPSLFEATTQAGLYSLAGHRPDGEAWQAAFGVNAGAWEESDLRRRAIPAMPAGPAPDHSNLSTPAPASPSDLWPLLVVLVIVGLLLEARWAWR